MRALIAIALTALLSCAGSSALAEKRIALVIGNGAYMEAAALTNTRNDASDLAAALGRLDFDVMQGIDLDKRAMERLVREFDDKLDGADIAMFFYAGHGLQVSGQNYLVPIDARLLAERDVDFESVPLNLVLKRMERHAKTSIVLLDACRDNPLARNLAARLGTRGLEIGRGLSRVESGIGTLIGFSTQPGNIALDGYGRNSPYATALLDEIERPDRDVLATLAVVRGKVIKATNGKQVPWEHTSLLVPVVLKGASKQDAGAVPPGDGTRSSVGEAARAWQLIENLEDLSLFEAFRKEFGASNFNYDLLAVQKIVSLKRVQVERERLAALKAEEDKKRAKAEQERLDALKAEEDKKRAKAEQERLWALKVEEDKRRKSEQQRLAALQADDATPLADARRRAEEEVARRDPALSIEAGSGQIFRDPLADGQPCASCPELLVVPAGEFLMGSTAAEIAAVSAERPDLAKYFNWEAPQGKVTIARKLAIGRSHITRGEFTAFVDATGHKTEAGCHVHDGGEWKLDGRRNWRSPGFEQTDRHPVVCVSWTDANAYADWLSKLTGRSYRLLSEAEAEYAARATTRATQMPRYFFGNDTKDLCAYANGANRTAIAVLGWDHQQVAPCESGHVYTAPVASFKANAWGLHDMHGNAWSWTADCWNDSLAEATADGSVRAIGDCERRVVRGGSWANGPRDLRSAARDSNAIGERSGNLGFRLARGLSY